MSGPGSGFRLAETAALAESGLLRVAETPVGPVVLVHAAGWVHALADRCPHAAAMLSQGFVEDGRLVCPTHFAAFDLETGLAVDAPPNCPAATVFPVIEHDGGLFLALPFPPAQEPLK